MYKASTWTKRRQIGVFVGRRRLVTDDNVFFLKEEKRERVLLSSLKALEKCVCGQRMAFRCKAKWWKIPNEKIHTGRRIGKKRYPFSSPTTPRLVFFVVRVVSWMVYDKIFRRHGAVTQTMASDCREWINVVQRGPLHLAVKRINWFFFRFFSMCNDRNNKRKKKKTHFFSSDETKLFSFLF